jgi:hypothetical protein
MGSGRLGDGLSRPRPGGLDGGAVSSGRGPRRWVILPWAAAFHLANRP